MLTRNATLAALVTPFILACVGCPPPQGGPTTGTVEVTLQDAPLDAEKVEVTISEVSVHFVPKGKASGTSEAADTSNDPLKAGWRAVLSKETTFDLLKLKDNPSALGTLTLGEGKITQIRLWVSETKPPQITVKGQAFPMTVPSGKVKVVGNFDVKPGQKTQIKLDFDAAESVKKKGDSYTLKPTIKLLK